MELLINKKP